MEFTTKQRDSLKSGFSNAFLLKARLEDAFKQKHPELYDEIVTDYLVYDGFPREVDKSKVEYSLELFAESDVMVDILEDRDVLENEEQYLSSVNSEDFYIENIVEVPMYLEPTVKIKTDAEQYLQLNPTVEYLAEKIYNAYEERQFAEMLIQDKEIQQNIIYEAVQNGFSEDVDLSRLRFSINPRLTQDFDGIARRVIDKGEIGENSTVDMFLNDRLYAYIKNENLFEPNITIDDTPEEYEEL